MLRSLQDKINQAVNAGRWAEAVDHLSQLLAVTKSAQARARTAYTIAVFYRDKLGEPRQAAVYFQQALNEDPTQVQAFDALEGLLRATKDWRGLEALIKGFIQRAQALEVGALDPAALFGAWFKLGELYGSRLGQLDTASLAFEQAKALRPQSLETHRALIDLYSRQQRYDAAIATCMSALALDPVPGEAPAAAAARAADFYHALFTFYMHLHRFDAAWCVSAVLVHSRAAEKLEADLYAHYLSAGPPTAQGRFNNELWALVSHPLENMRVSNIMAVVGAACRDLFSYDLSHWGLKKKSRLDANANLLVCKLFQYLSGVVGLAPLPELYLNGEQRLGVFNANLTPTAWILGVDAAQPTSPKELAFQVGRQAALTTPQHYMAALGFTDEILKGYMMGAIIACSPAPPAVTDQALAGIVKQLAKMPAPMKVDLAKMMRPILDAEMEVDLGAWLRGVDYTVNRVGLLLCGDLVTAIQALRNDNRPLSGLTNAERERDLVAFSISPGYLQAREMLGVAIG